MKVEIQDQDINVDEIMRQIRKNIRYRKYDGEVDLEQLGKLYSVNQPSQNSSFMSVLLKEQSNLNRTWSYSADSLISSNRNFIGRLVVFGKKAVRKCLRWYVNSVVDKQVLFNASVVRALNQLVELTRQHSEAIASQDKLDQLEERLVRLEKSVQSLRHALFNESSKSGRNG